MKRLQTLIFAVLLLAVATVTMMVWNYQAQTNAAQDGALDPDADASSEVSAEPASAPPVINSEPPVSTDPELTATLAVAGDVIVHAGINSEAQTGDGYDYTALFSEVSGYISSADFAVCTMSTALTSSGEYSAYPLFVSPAQLASGLGSVGFDLVSTATVHALDNGTAGVISTLDVLDGAGLAHVGTSRSAEELEEQNGIAIAEMNGMKVAFIAYTYDTNETLAAGREYAVNVFRNAEEEPDYERINADIAKAKELEADFIVVMIQWGLELFDTVSDEQSELAQYLVSAGADIIVGGHPHVIQPFETITVNDSAGNRRTGYVFYSLGSILSCYNDESTEITAIVNITLKKDPASGLARISQVSFTPLLMADMEDYSLDTSPWRYKLLDIHAVIDAYDAGTYEGQMSSGLYKVLTDGLEVAYEMLGSFRDSYLIQKDSE